MNPSLPFDGALWIASSIAGGQRSSPPAPYFRKEFSLARPVREARLTITALGLYECEINGKPINDHVFAPGWTDYRKRIPYQTLDVTALLKQGNNAIGALLGDGWSCGYISFKGRQNYTDRPKLLARLDVVLDDSSAVSILTDDSWKTAVGPLLENDFLRGEIYDAQLELAGWSQVGFDDTAWARALVQATPSAQLSLATIPPVRRISEITPISHRDWEIHWPRTRTYDFGQNFAGRVRIAVKAARGTTVTIRHAEILNPDGTLYTENLRSAKATDCYTCSGEGVESWEPRFTYHGFRHVEITCDTKWENLEVTGVVLHSDIKPTGHFSCSNPLLNQLQHNIVWGQKSNFIEVPTDCPQRDERLGWTGDAQIFTRTGCFNFDIREFIHKWMQDIRDSQRQNGALPSTAPELFGAIFLDMEDGGPAYSDAMVICPWTIHLCYDDRKILEDNYNAMQRYMEFIRTQRCVGEIREHPDIKGHWKGFGDWLALDGSGKNDGATPKDLIGTALYAHVTDIMAQTSAVLGKEKDSARYRELHSKIVAAFQKRFISNEGLITSGTQTSYVLVLRFNLVPDELRAAALKELVRDIEGRNFHLSTGFVGTPYLMDVLQQYNCLDVAYKVLEQETFPSWLYPVKNGATTVWERWDGWTPEKGFQDKIMNSFNHFAYGAVGNWIYRNVGGLDLDPAEPGYRHIIFRPLPCGTITWAETRLETPQGQTSIRWDLKEDQIAFDLVVPTGARATLFVPEAFGGKKVEFTPGRHQLAQKKSPI